MTRRLYTRAYNRNSQGARRQFAGGSMWRTIAKGPSVRGRGDVILLLQARLRGITEPAYVRFARLYPNGRMDGTGDADLIAGQRFLVHTHLLDRADFQVLAQIRAPEPFVVDYCYLKASA